MQRGCLIRGFIFIVIPLSVQARFSISESAKVMQGGRKIGLHVSIYHRGSLGLQRMSPGELPQRFKVLRLKIIFHCILAEI